MGVMYNVMLAAASKIDPNEINIDPVRNADSFIGDILVPVYAWAGITAVLIIITAGFFYVTSGGNPSHTKRAREAIIYACVGLVVIMMAFVITQFVLGRF